MKMTKHALQGISKLAREGRIVSGPAPRMAQASRTMSWPTMASLGGNIAVSVPPTSNHLFSTIPGKSGKSRRVKTSAYRAWIKSALPILSLVAADGPPPYELFMVIMQGDDWTKGSDVANREKALTDTLVKAGVIPNDHSEIIAGVRISIGPRISGDSRMAVWLAPATDWWENQ